MSEHQLQITDHAVLRYLERVHGIDVEYFRDCVRSEIGNSYRKDGVVYMEGISYLYRDFTLVSVIKGQYKLKEFWALR